MDSAKYRHGIAAWTAAVFIRDYPACTYRQIEAILNRDIAQANWRIMFTPSERHRNRRSIGSTAMGLFWTRELGPREEGRQRRVYRFTITPQGEEFASGPMPPTHEELREQRALRMRNSLHPADWVKMVDPSELLMIRRSTTSGGRWVCGDSAADPGSDSSTADRFVTIDREELMVLVDRSRCIHTSYDHARRRLVHHGHVQVLTMRGRLLWVGVSLLKPVKPVRRNTSNTNSSK